MDATPVTPVNRFDEEGDWIARQFFSPDDLRLAPDEYVARHAHRIGAFALHRYRYRDPGLATWVGRVGELLASESEIARCRERFLSPAELDEVRRQAAEDF